VVTDAYNQSAAAAHESLPMDANGALQAPHLRASLQIPGTPFAL
jgi:hypothetical protein